MNSGFSSTDPEGLGKGLLFGSDEGFSPDFRQLVQETGVTHLVAASGANLQYILTAPRCLVQGRSWRLWQLVSLGTILWYWQVAEQSGSLWRAIMMWGSLWLATWWGRAGSRVYIWILTTLVSAGLRPEQLSHSYWLSSLAIGGVLFSQILISSENNNRLLTNYEKRMRGWSKSYLQGSVVFAMVAGYLWWQWQSWQPVGILTTLLLDPVVPAYIGVSSGLLLADWLGIPQVESWFAQGQRWLFVVVWCLLQGVKSANLVAHQGVAWCVCFLGMGLMLRAAWAWWRQQHQWQRWRGTLCLSK
jgi:hypothetical protein